MVTKKRYVGEFFENAQDKAKLEVKGLEMMRSDGCESLQRVMRGCV